MAKEHKEMLKVLRGRFDEREDNRREFVFQWQDVAEQVAGRRDMEGTLTPGQSRTTFIYDTTAMHSGGLLASGLHSLLSNPLTRWFNLAPNDQRLLGDVEVQGWLEETESLLLGRFRSPRGGFNRTMHETYIDEVWFGNAGVFTEDVSGQGPVYVAQPLKTLYWAENEYGAVDTWFRKIELSARVAVKKFGDDAGKEAKKLIEAGKYEKKIAYLHSITPTDDPDPKSLMPQRRMKFHSVYQPFDEMILASEGGYEEEPIATPRWQKNSGEDYGYGPGMFASPAAMGLNEAQKTVLTGAQKAVNPPILVADSNVLKTPVRVHPGGVMVAREDAFNMRQAPVQSFPIDARGIGIGVQQIQMQQAMVRQHFLPELLQMITNQGKTPMTATQVMEISNQFMANQAPILGSQHNELLGPMLQRSYAIESRRGSFSPPPPALMESGIKVEYLSPASMAQRQGEVTAIQQTFLDAQQWAQSNPDVLQNLSADEGIRKLAQFRGVPASVVVSMAEVLQRREAEAKVEQQQQLLQEMKVGGEALKNVGSAEQSLASAQESGVPQGAPA